MPKIKYISKRFNRQSIEIIEQANVIIEDYQDQGFDLTLRQLYYQFVSRDLIPNRQSEYNRLGNVVNNARLAGLIDWNTITDRTRNLQSNSHWGSPSDIIKVCEEAYQIDKWKDQPFRPEVWIEKDALTGIIDPICSDLDIPYFSCRGYTSQSEMWRASLRIRNYMMDGQTPIILHFGDHDPSGLDMTRDIQERLEMFTYDKVEIKVLRLALNREQINKYRPPPNPAKITDTRAKAYIMEFGDESWELDALEPSTLTNLIYEHIVVLRDENLWQESVKLEHEHKQKLREIAENIS